MYEVGPPPLYDKSGWLDDKFNLGLDFPNLPYLIDGQVKLTEYEAIMQYICNKYCPDYLGKTDEEKVRVW